MNPGKELLPVPLVDATRFFSMSKSLRSRTINRVGGQVARACLARTAYHLRPTRARILASEEQAIRQDGMLRREGYLDERTIAGLRKEVLRLFDQYPQLTTIHDHGATRVEHLDLRLVQAREALGSLLRDRLDDAQLSSWFRFAERRPVRLGRDVHCLLERVTYGAAGGEDQENALHTDIFFHTHKAWIYLAEVTPARGPLICVPRSHHLDSTRLRFEYRESVGRNQGSRRIGLDELQARGLKEVALAAPAGTLVLANTHGYHRRGAGQPGEERLAMVFTARSNPFFPMPVNRFVETVKRHARGTN